MTEIGKLLRVVLFSAHKHRYQRRKDEDTVISIKAFFLAAYQGCFLIFVSVFRRSVSDSLPYLFCRPCLPLHTSFPVIPRLLAARVSLRRPFCLCVLSGTFLLGQRENSATRAENLRRPE